MLCIGYGLAELSDPVLSQLIKQSDFPIVIGEALITKKSSTCVPCDPELFQLLGSPVIVKNVIVQFIYSTNGHTITSIGHTSWRI